MINILVVDDDISMQQLLRHYLSKAGYSVMVAGSGEEALSKKFSVMPDLIIVDRIMAELDGFDLVRKLKSKKPSVYRRVIMLTVCSTPLDVLEGLNAGADDYIVKPFKPNILLARVKTQLRIKDTIDDLRSEVNDLEKQLAQQSQARTISPDDSKKRIDSNDNDEKSNNIDDPLRELDLNLDINALSGHEINNKEEWADSVKNIGSRQIAASFSRRKRPWTRRYRLYIAIFGISILLSSILIFIEKKVLPSFRDALHKQGQFYEPKDFKRDEIKRKSL